MDRRLVFLDSFRNLLGDDLKKLLEVADVEFVESVNDTDYYRLTVKDSHVIDEHKNLMLVTRPNEEKALASANKESVIIKKLQEIIWMSFFPHINMMIGPFKTSCDQLGRSGDSKELLAMIYEYPNRSRLSEYFKKHQKKFKLDHWKIFIFQIMSTLVFIRSHYPDFRHNNLIVDNVYVSRIDNKRQRFTYLLNKKKYNVKNIGYQLRIGHFDLATITNNETTQCYDIFTFLQSISETHILNKYGPPEIKEFIDRIISHHYESFSPEKILSSDPLFDEHRVITI